MEKTIKKLMAIFLSICMLMTIFIPYRIEASQTTTKQNKTEVHPLELYSSSDNRVSIRGRLDQDYR